MHNRLQDGNIKFFVQNYTDESFLFSRLETVTEETLRVASMLLSSQTFREVDVVDFDYHFNDITRDWRNLPINDLLQKCT